MNESFVVQILRIGVESQVLWGDEEKTGVLVKKEDVVRAIEKLMDEGNEREERRKKAKEIAELDKKSCRRRILSFQCNPANPIFSSSPQITGLSTPTLTPILSTCSTNSHSRIVPETTVT